MSNIVYVPRGESLIRRGSGVVGTEASQGLVVVDYEGNLYGAANLVTFADRVRHAYGRHVVQYPTVARQTMHEDSLRRIGEWNESRGEVVLDDDAARAALAEWLDLGSVGLNELRVSS